MLLRAGQEYSIIRIFVRWVGIGFSIFEIRISFFFFNHLASPTKRFSTVRLAEHLATDYSPMKDIRADPIASYISWKIFYYERACHTSTFEIMNLSTQKTRHVNGPSFCERFFFLSTVPRCKRKSWISDSVQVALVLQTRCTDVKPLWESEREKTRSSWITHAVVQWLI